MLLLFTPRLNPRIEYAAEVCFKHAFKLDYRITTDILEFEKSDDPCFWYAVERVSSKPGIFADAMMLDEKIIINSPGHTIIKKNVVLFPTESHLLPKFDLLAATLWHVTRMEEYDHFAKNALSRFTSDMSFSRKIGILQKPAINIWTELFLEELKLLYPDLVFDKPIFKYIPTVDVDSVFMYKSKGLLRGAGGLLRDLLKKDMSAVKKRWRVVTGKEPDPWFCFDNINSLHKKYDLSPYYFFLVARYGVLDKNISPSNKDVKKLIGELVKDFNVGVHNSYRGNDHPKVWSKERKVLQRLASKEVFSSRQHYLFVRYPSTYEELLKLGIKCDFSMIYPDMVGFRMGITVPVPFFNLKTNVKTDLWLYPTMIMDVGLTKYQKLSKEEALVQCLQIVEYSKKYGGTLVTLWHNESLSEYGPWAGWNKVYEAILKEATKD